MRESEYISCHITVAFATINEPLWLVHTKRLRYIDGQSGHAIILPVTVTMTESFGVNEPLHEQKK